VIDSIVKFLWDYGYWIIGAIKVAVVAVVLMSSVPLLVWLERRLMGRFQVRLGPNRVGPFGLGQPFADSLKLLFKESIVQNSADKFLFFLAPAIVVFTAITTFAAVPFGSSFKLFGRDIGMQVAHINMGLLFVFAVSSMGVYGIVLAGFSSNNKYSLIGGLRSSAQMISYELILGLSALGVVVLAGSLDLADIVASQKTLPNIVTQPVAFILFYIAGVAETNRAPFDLPEAEQELVAGFHTEYSGMKFAMFFMAEYINMITMSAMITVLFLGGWHAYFIPDFLIPPIIGPLVIFVAKVFLLLCAYIWLRCTFPRIRYDRLMSFSWKVMAPLALANLMVTSVLKVL
jgi:NADH-quinone oxidoreductase subunit H